MYIQNGEPRTIPDLPAYRDDRGFLHVWCRYCACWHHHGIGAGHRVAHCVYPDSAYLPGGYTLVDAGTWTDRVRAGHRERRMRRCPRCYHPIAHGLCIERCARCSRLLPIGWRHREHSGWLAAGRHDPRPNVAPTNTLEEVCR